MADESNTGRVAAAEAAAETKAAASKRKSAPRRQKTAAEQVAASKTTAKPKRYSETERTEKLNLIETEVAQGNSTLKDAIKNAGISEQTYYVWKKSAKPADRKADASVVAGDEFADLIQLEKENLRLRHLLSEKLRAENAELRKRLALD
ncbi:transcriptional regulator [Ensifer sp. NBAIM29]|nr:transcriptional regulator [Bradyrhizobium sp. BRP14]MCA1493655.1 transcriptional regulator [Ensifer sp. NBAIM29]